MADSPGSLSLAAAFAEDASAIICAKDIEGRFVLINRLFEVIFHVERSRVLGRTDSDIFSPELAARNAAIHRRVLSTGTPEQIEEYLAVGGRSRLFFTLTFRIGTAGGWSGTGCIAFDISDRKRLTEGADQLREKRIELERAVVASLPAHIAVLDRDGIIVQVNEAWERFAIANGATGLASVCAGVNYLDVCRRASGESSEDAAKALKGISAVLQREESGFSLEYQCHSPSEKRWFLLRTAPLMIDSGGAVVSHSDITERVVAEQNLMQTYGFFRALIENASDIVTIVDGAAVIRYQSPSIARVLGYGQDELIGRSSFDFVHPSDVAKMRAVLETLREPGAAGSPLEVRIRHSGGTWRYIEGIARNAMDDPAVNGIVVTSRDVTERRLAERALRTKEAALRNSHRALQAVTARLLEAEETERRRLSRELHDDLNQNLAIIAVDAGALAKTLPGAEEPVIERELRALQARLTQICGQVRTMAYQLHPSILDDLGLAVALRSYCSEFSRREHIDVTFTHRNVPEPIPPACASTLYRIAQEALRNVSKHSGATTVSVSLTGTDATIKLIVRDDGAGFRVDAARARASLGLTSMEERARMVGGSLAISSVPGRGTTVLARIPVRRRTA